MSIGPIYVLYLHHVGPFGGASRSLLEMLRSFPQGAVKAYGVLQQGAFADILERYGIEVERSYGMAQFGNHRFSYYRGWRWLVLLREIVFVPFTWAALRRARRRWPQIDLIHVNEISLLPTLCLARFLWKKPAIVHVRALQRLANGWRNRVFYRLLKQHAAQVVAIDENVQLTLPSSLHAVVVHNGFHPPERLGFPKMPDHAQSNRPFTVAMVGNLLRAKGCIEFVQAAALLKQRGLAVRFVFVGASVRPSRGVKQALLRLFGLSQQIEQEVESIIKSESLQHMIEFRGSTTDLAKVYSDIDVICFPSHLDAPGRPIFEAAFFGVPSVLAISQPQPDTFIDGETGIKIPTRDALALADAIAFLYDHPEERHRMGEEARRMAYNSFDAIKNAKRMLEIYQKVLGDNSKTD